MIFAIFCLYFIHIIGYECIVFRNKLTYLLTYLFAGLSVFQVRIREEDEGWIYGMYTCRAINKMGSTDYEIELRRARKRLGCHSDLYYL